jgi:N-acetylmuramoyl-L-alanine amidase
MRTMAVALAVAAASIGTAAIPSRARADYHAPVLNSARIVRRGPSLELHFEFDGSPPRLDLSAHGDQLWIALPRTHIALPPRPLFGREVAPVASVRLIDEGAGSSRIVIEVVGKADYAALRLKHEIVVRVATLGADPNIAAPIIVREQPAPRNRAEISRPRAGGGAASESAELSAPVAPKYRYNGPAVVSPQPSRGEVEPGVESAVASPEISAGHQLVMIDPGHGGYDPGTQSAAGIDEKDLALQIAARVKSALEARGIRAELTRNTDTFISLAERTRIANRAGADLFVSIHLNSSPNIDTTGIEVYYLNNTTDRATIRLARIENGGGAGYGAPVNSNLNYILTDLRQNYKASEAASLARMIDAQTVANLDAGLGLNVNALGAKMGPFYVLVGAQMPAVLVECGFMSNAAEASRLANANYQGLLANGIAGAVVHYFNADLAVGNL